MAERDFPGAIAAAAELGPAGRPVLRRGARDGRRRARCARTDCGSCSTSVTPWARSATSRRSRGRDGRSPSSCTWSRTRPARPRPGSSRPSRRSSPGRSSRSSAIRGSRRVEDVHLAAARARGRRAVVLFTLVEPELREVDARPLQAVPAPLLRPARTSDRGGRPRVRLAGDPAAPGRAACSTRATSSGSRRSSSPSATTTAPARTSCNEADIVLVGVSRSSKTPLSMYLAYLGYKTANVPIVKGIEPPAALSKLDPAKVVGLTIDAEALAAIRGERVRGMGGGGPLRRPGRDLRGARVRGVDPQASRLPRDRGVESRHRGDGKADRPYRRGAPPARGYACVTVKPSIPWYYWPFWFVVLAAGLFVFYVLLTPVWMGIRLVYWFAERRSAGTEK